jgi:hypothetical protein
LFVPCPEAPLEEQAGKQALSTLCSADKPALIVGKNIFCL